LIHDSKIIKDLGAEYTSTYSGFLSKLTLIVGFYGRHKEAYSAEYKLFSADLKRFKSFYDDRVQKNKIIFSSDIEEVREVVETGVSNIKSILDTSN